MNRGPRRSEPFPSGSAHNAGAKRRHSDGFPFQRKRQRRTRTDPGLNISRPIPFSISRETEDGVPGIIIAFRGFPNNVPPPTRLEFQEVLEDLFAEFQDDRGKVINFDVFMRHNDPPVAFVTMPYAELGEFFVNSDDFDVEWNGVVLRKSIDRKQPDPMLLDDLRRIDYVPAAEARRREELARELQESLALSQLSFGAWHENSFSPEYTIQTNAADVSMKIFYHSTRCALVIEKEAVQVNLEQQRNHPARLLTIIPAHEINRIFAQSDGTIHSILFQMHSSVQFELDDLVEGSTSRNFSFDMEHEVLAPFTSAFILINFKDALTYRLFQDKMSKASHIPRVQLRFFRVRELAVYDKRHLLSLDRWYQSIPLAVALQCEQAIHGGALTPVQLQALRPLIDETLIESEKEVVVAAMQDIIIYFSDQDPMKRWVSILTIEQKFREGKAQAMAMAANMRRAKDVNNFACHQLFMTPTSFILEGPYVDKSNRVLRTYENFHEHFLRVSFTEEGGQNRRLSKTHGSNMDFRDLINRKIGVTLNEGFRLAGRKWEWLGYSQSALKDRQMLFVVPFVDEADRLVDGDQIRQDIGAFEAVQKIPAKYGARIAQAFSATSSSIVISDDEYISIPDIERNEVTFTDGAGDMSVEMAKEVWSKISHRRLHDPDPPSAFQARFAGCKGVWMVNPELPGKQLRCTPSQTKFESLSRTFDVANHSLYPGVTFLNRPLVKLLEDLGIEKDTFLRIQQRAVDQAELASTSFEHAAVHFAKNNLGLPFRMARLYDNLQSMLGIDFDASPLGHIDFYKSVAMLGVTAVLRDIKYKARIQVAGPTLIGVCDTWGYLKEGEIYVKVKGQHTSRIIRGRVAVTRSPVVHPGDVQTAMAVNVPRDHPLATLVNVVVFSSQGRRPLPSMLGGGDLDGDLFNVITDFDLIPSRTEEPGSYEPARPNELNRISQMKDVADFVCEYIYSDVVGQLSTRHLLIADYSELGSRDPRCLELAKLSSHAVDFVKSGRPVDRQLIPKRPCLYTPDFMAREDEEKTYKSNKALGEMFRAVPIQKYLRPLGETQNKVDASVLHKILASVEIKYAQLPLRQWTSKRSEFAWKAYAVLFCAECEKIAFRNSLSRRDNHKLGEEELAVGTTGSLRVENGEMDMMHRARTQMSELVRKMRIYIKDLKEGDEDLEEDHVELESDDDGNVAIVKKEEQGDEDDSSLLAKLAANPELAVERVNVEEQTSDDEVEEIDAALWGVKREGTDLSPSEGGSESGNEEDDDQVEETRRPDWRILAAGRAYGACVYAQDALETPKVPFGMRLFSMVAVETLLSIIRSMS